MFSSLPLILARRVPFALAAALLTLAGLFAASFAIRAVDAAPSGSAIPTRPAAAMTVYSFRERGLCPACDRTRPVVEKLARVYPIAVVCRDVPGGRERCEPAGVNAFPTFVLNVAYPGAPSFELARWSGARNAEERIRDAFRRAGVVPGEYRPR